MTDDELPGSPLWDALLAPGTADELAGEDAALAAFRAAGAADRRRRRMHRLGVGGAGLFLFAATGGGVAAAVTGRLPAPLQKVLHEALPAIAPAPEPPKHVVAAREGAPHPSPTSTSTHHGTPGSSAVLPLGPRPSAVPVVTVAPKATPSASASVPALTVSPTASPSASPSPAAAPTLTASTSAKTVALHGNVAVRGKLIRGTKGLSGKTVWLQRKYPGADWTRIDHTSTDANGVVTFTVKDLTRNAGYRLTYATLTTAAHPVVVTPVVDHKVTVPAKGKRLIHVTTEGCLSGDKVQLLRLVGTTWKLVTSASLNANAAANFTVNAAPAGTTVRYRVKVVATARHGEGLEPVTLTSPKA